MQTGTDIDTIYTFSGVSHDISAGKFVTTLSAVPTPNKITINNMLKLEQNKKKLNDIVKDKSNAVFNKAIEELQLQIDKQRRLAELAAAAARRKVADTAGGLGGFIGINETYNGMRVYKQRTVKGEIIIGSSNMWVMDPNNNLIRVFPSNLNDVGNTEAFTPFTKSDIPVKAYTKAEEKYIDEQRKKQKAKAKAKEAKEAKAKKP